MARVILLGAACLAALAVSGAATAKGPSAARIDGPGLASPLVLRGFGESGEGALGALTMEGGFFATTFGQVPDERLPGRPGGSLGPRYTIDYTVPAGDTTPSHVAQDMYPYARGGPVLYLAPGQAMFEGGGATFGGWVRAPGSLLAALVAAGLPATAPRGGSGTTLLDPVLLGGLGALLLGASAGIYLLWRRDGRAPSGSGAASA